MNPASPLIRAKDTKLSNPVSRDMGGWKVTSTANILEPSSFFEGFFEEAHFSRFGKELRPKEGGTTTGIIIQSNRQHTTLNKKIELYNTLWYTSIWAPWWGRGRSDFNLSASHLLVCLGSLGRWFQLRSRPDFLQAEEPKHWDNETMSGEFLAPIHSDCLQVARNEEKTTTNTKCLDFEGDWNQRQGSYGKYRKILECTDVSTRQEGNEAADDKNAQKSDFLRGSLCSSREGSCHPENAKATPA